MQLVVNDQVTVIPVEPGRTLRELARSICPPAGPQGSLIVSVRCDGREMTDQQLDAALEKPAMQFKEVAFQTQSLGVLVAQNLSGASNSLASADALRVEAADLIAGGREQDGLALLLQLFANWRQLQESFLLCAQALGLSLNQLEESGVPLGDITRKAKDQLTELKTSLEAGDLVVVGDILRFELQQTIEQWQRALDCLRSRIHPH